MPTYPAPSISQAYTYVQSSQPAAPVVGETWFDTSASEGKAFDGAGWQLLTATEHGELNGLTPSDHHNPVTTTGPLTVDADQTLGLTVDGGLAVTSDGKLVPLLGPGLGLDANGNIVTDLAAGLTIDANGDVRVADGGVTEAMLAFDTANQSELDSVQSSLSSDISSVSSNLDSHASTTNAHRTDSNIRSVVDGADLGGMSIGGLSLGTAPDSTRRYIAPEDGSGSPQWSRELSFDPNKGEWNIEGTPRAAGSKIWTAGNDGAGSGLDADTVDGKQASDLETPASTQTASTGATWYEYAADDSQAGTTTRPHVPCDGLRGSGATFDSVSVELADGRSYTVDTEGNSVTFEPGIAVAVSTSSTDGTYGTVSAELRVGAVLGHDHPM